jgi:2,3-dihydroxybenzoate-AMP ligase
MDTEREFSPWPEATREAYRRAGYWIDRPLVDILRRQRAERGAATALIDGDLRLSFAALDDASEDLARRLLDSGLRPGDKAVVQLPNSAAYYVAFWALLKIGVKAVYAVFSHNAHELEAYCRQLEPKLLILSRRHRLFESDDFLDRTLRPISAPHVLMLDSFVPGDAPAAPRIEVALKADEVALFQLSGGSTSTPKLIPRTHDDYYYSVRRSVDVSGVDAATVYLCALPAPHNFPMSSPGALGVWHAGGTVVVAPDPAPTSCFPLIEQHGVSMTSLVPPLLPLWLAAAERQRDKLRSLRLLQVGGAKLSETVARRIEPELGCRLQQVFGMAEGLVCYTRLDDDDWHRHHTQGVPMSEADEIRIVDADGKPVPAGEPGLLTTRGPYTIRGYFRAAAHNRLAFDAEGFYRTGDVVRQTPSGHLIVLGREKDQINRGGEKIAAEEIETLLLRHQRVVQAAVVAVPDSCLGEKSCAFVVCRDGMPKPHLLRKHLRDCGIADYKLPDRFVELDALPLTPIGKPDKMQLRVRVEPKAASETTEEPT